MSVNEIYKASVIFSAPGADGDMVYNLHYRTTEVNSPISNSAEGLEIAQEVADITDDLYLPSLADAFTFERVDVIGITDPLVGQTVVVNLPGESANEVLPFRSAPVVKLLTGIRGRSFRGRVFLMAPAENQQDGGVLGGGTITAIDTYIADLNQLNQQPSTNVYRLTIYSETLSSPPTTFIDNLVATRLVNPTLGSQRRRQEV